MVELDVWELLGDLVHDLEEEEKETTSQISDEKTRSNESEEKEYSSPHPT